MLTSAADHGQRGEAAGAVAAATDVGDPVAVGMSFSGARKQYFGAREQGCDLVLPLITATTGRCRQKGSVVVAEVLFSIAPAAVMFIKFAGIGACALCIFFCAGEQRSG